MNRAGPRLTALLDALEQEILAASADDVQDARRATARARHAACAEIRSLLTDALAESEDAAAIAMPAEICAATRLYRH